MMPAEILSLVSRHGITLGVENKKLRFQAPKGALTPELRNLLSENRDGIIAYLENHRLPALALEREAIAVIGMDCRFPGANNARQYWENMKNGIESIRRFTDDELKAMGISSEIYNAPNYVKAAPIIDNSDMFDAEFFGYSPKDADIMDPQQRLFLECAWNALEIAGYNPGVYKGKIGVFGGAGPNYYHRSYAAQANALSVSEVYQMELGNENDYLATRVAYKLGLKGPALTIQTACSTSLVSAHMACQNLLMHQCDMALAGGVSVNVRLKGGYFYEEGLIPSPDGHCRAFDAKSQGTVGGQGVGIVVLKRLSDAVADGDNISAVIRGSAINNDGAAKVGFTAPSIIGQSEVIIEALGAAGVSAEDIGCLEAHGTGTPLGDPIEIKALTKAFRMSTDKCDYCAIGSVKTNIGHLDAAAGVAGLIKTILMLEYKEIPASLHFQEPNPNIDFKNSPFFVNTQLKKWDGNGSPRRAGVSSFGLGGTNAHMVLEEAPTLTSSGPSFRTWHPLVLSARTEKALKAAILNMASHLERNPGLNLADVAFTLQVGRKTFPHRGTVVCSDLNDAIAALRSTPPGRVISEFCETGHKDVVFMFSGQGSQYANMGLGLYKDEPVFREQIDYCSEILQQEIPVDLRQLLYPEHDKIEEAEERLRQTSITQPALFTIEYALAKLWMSWGIQPWALVGHSIGEYTAACLSGVFTLEEALKLVAARGRLMQDMPRGSMLAVFLPEEQVAPLIKDDLSVSVINSPSICVISGEDGKIDDLEKSLSQRQTMCRRLQTSHAFHSKMMDPVLEPFTEYVKKIRLEPPKIPFLSNLTGTWITQEEATDPGYWARQLRGTVRFADCVQELFKEPNRVLLEVGPGAALSVLAGQHPAKEKSHAVFSSTRHPKTPQSDSGFILDTLCGLWRAGVSIDWTAFQAGDNRRRVRLPTYPFERKRHWIESRNQQPETACVSPDRNQDRESQSPLDGGRKEGETRIEKEGENIQVKDKHMSRSEVEKTLTDIWRELLGHTEVTIDDNFFALGGHSLVALRMFTRIDTIFHKRLPLATLLSAPTVRQLASLLTQAEFAPSWSSLVKIQAEGTKPPFFLIHSEGGNVLEYFKLASCLDQNIPIYGIQAIGLEGDKIISMSIEEMARHYIGEIKSVQPNGPYFIGGYCLGGLISFEMARQLESGGEKIAFLALISTVSPDHLKRQIPGLSLSRRFLFRILDRIELEADNLSVLKLKGKLTYFGDRARRTELMTRIHYENFADFLFRKIRRTPYKHSRRYLLEQTRMEQAKAFYAYEPTPIKTRITLFRTSRQPRELLRDSTLGWADLSENGICDYEVRAFHKNILKEPKVRSLSEKMQACIDEAQGCLR